MDTKTHHTKRADGTYPYPDQDYIIDQLLPADYLVVAGFHRGDCVDKLAQRAHERGIRTLVDEDLTELFADRLMDPDFRLDHYPTYDARKHHPGIHFQFFMKARENKPWLWQEY